MTRAGVRERLATDHVRDREFSLARGLAIVTVLTSVFGRLFPVSQRLSGQGQHPGRDAWPRRPATFLEISNALAEMQFAAAIALFRISRGAFDGQDGRQRAQSLDVRNGQRIVSDAYEKARPALSASIERAGAKG